MYQNSKTDLMTLPHPLMLLSIFVLVINDHVLKVHFPSALTGKISDFAGLFFFPILLSAILHFVLKPFQFQSRNIAFASFGFTTIFFSLIKTVPFLSDFIEELFSIQIILDPSDLMALIMLPLAWNLREKVANESKTGISKLSYIVLGIASVATIATTPPYIPTITNLVVHKKIIYADFRYNSLEREFNLYFYSLNGGITWRKLHLQPPNEFLEQIGQFHNLPVKLCLPNNQNICYQTGEEVILESNDGGQTWTTSWEFPLGRKEFFYRNTSYVDLGPYDLVYIELDGKQIVIAAMGSGGVLVKIDNNQWESIKVGVAGPIYFSARDISEAQNVIETELLIIYILTFIFFYINIIMYPQRRTVGFYLLMGFPLVFFAIFYLYSFDTILHIVFEVIAITFFIIILLLSSIQFLTNVKPIAKNNVILIMVISFLSYSLFILWAYGIIPVYKTSLWIAISLNFLLLLWILYLPIKEFIQTKISPPKRDLPE